MQVEFANEHYLRVVQSKLLRQRRNFCEESSRCWRRAWVVCGQLLHTDGRKRHSDSHSLEGDWHGVQLDPSPLSTDSIATGNDDPFPGYLASMDLIFALEEGAP